MAPTRILIVGHSAVLYTGSAEVLRLIFQPLLASFTDKYCIEQVGLMHFSAVVEPPWPITPTEAVADCRAMPVLALDDIAGQRTFEAVVQRFRPDIVFAHNDPQNVTYLLDLRKRSPWKLVLYINFDGRPVPSCFDCLMQADALITLSGFSRDAYLSSLSSTHGRHVEVMYCPADVDRFAPASAEQRTALRKCNFPDWIAHDSFVIGWVGRNQWRKQIWILYETLSFLRTGEYFVCTKCGRVERSVPCTDRCGGCSFAHADPLQDIYMWMHFPTGKEIGCWGLNELESTFRTRSGRDVHYTQDCSRRRHLAPADMAALYQLWDVFLFPSGGEGFGLPAWEAMSSEIPIVYTDYSSHGEFIKAGDGGLPIGGLLQPEGQSGVLRMIARVEEAVQAVRRIYFDRELGVRLGQNGRAFANRFNLGRMAVEWDRMFTRVVADGK
jgi:glycosyltransferase involved in cell wall biosynthesis